VTAITVPFTKVVGAGNDFVVVDNRRRRFRRFAPLARWACDRRRGIGADGLVVAERSRRGDLRMRIFNPDGSEPAMCGNGARCVALHAYQAGWARRQMAIETRAGILAAHVLNGTRVRLRMPQPRSFAQQTLRVRGRSSQVATVTVGVPHAVLVVPDVAHVDVLGLGRALRYHRHFAPQGTNVDFVQVGRSTVRLRTYERGVEQETLACGTGATATAAILWKYYHRRSPVRVVTQSGETLCVRFQADTSTIQEISLEGPARVVFSGRLMWREG